MENPKYVETKEVFGNDFFYLKSSLMRTLTLSPTGTCCSWLLPGGGVVAGVVAGLSVGVVAGVVTDCCGGGDGARFWVGVVRDGVWVGWGVGGEGGGQGGWWLE